MVRLWSPEFLSLNKFNQQIFIKRVLCNFLNHIHNEYGKDNREERSIRESMTQDD